MLLHTPPLPAACLHSIVHEGFHWPAAVHREIAGTERSGILIRTGQEVKGSFTDKARETSKARPLAPGCRALSPDRSGGAGMYEAGGRHFPTASQGRHHATTHTHKHTLAHAQQGLRKGNHSPISFPHCVPTLPATTSWSHTDQPLLRGNLGYLKNPEPTARKRALDMGERCGRNVVVKGVLSGPTGGAAKRGDGGWSSSRARCTPTGMYLGT